MSKAKPPVEAATEKKAEVKAEQPAIEAKPAEPTFTVAQLRPSARNLFGISQSTYDGATDGLTGEFTVAAMREHIEKWLKEEY